MYMITGFHKHAQEDNYERGWIGRSTDDFIDCPIKAATLDDLKKKIAQFLCVEVSDLDLDACEEQGRIDIGISEANDGIPASPYEIKRWREGKKALYYAKYSCYVMECKPVTLKPLLSLIDRQTMTAKVSKQPANHLKG